MSNTQKYKKAFIEGLGVDEKIITDKLKYNDITAKYIDMDKGAYLVQKSAKII